MANGVNKVDEALVVVGSSSRSVVDRVIIAFRGIDGCVVTQPSTDIVQIATTVKKKLSGRTTHVCVVTAVSEPQRLVVHVHGELQDDHHASLKAAVIGTSVEGLRDHVVDSFAAPPASPRNQAARPYSQPIAAPPSGQPGMQVPQNFSPQPNPQPNPPQPTRPQPFVNAQPLIGAQPFTPVHGHTGSSTPVAGRPPADWFVARPAQSPMAPVVPPTEHRLPSPSPQRPVPGAPPITPVRPMMGIPPPVATPSMIPNRRVCQLRLPDGRIFEVGPLLLIGRSPAATAQEHGATLISLGDDGVSKTHVAVGRRGDDIWVEDRHSMNGTVLVDQNGRHIVMIPRQQMLVRLPVTILVGDTAISLVQL